MDPDPFSLIPTTGSSTPKLFLDATLEDFENQTQLNYLGTVYFVHVGDHLAFPPPLRHCSLTYLYICRRVSGSCVRTRSRER